MLERWSLRRSLDQFSTGRQAITFTLTIKVLQTPRRPTCWQSCVLFHDQRVVTRTHIARRIFCTVQHPTESSSRIESFIRRRYLAMKTTLRRCHMYLVSYCLSSSTDGCIASSSNEQSMHRAHRVVCMYYIYLYLVDIICIVYHTFLRHALKRNLPNNCEINDCAIDRGHPKICCRVDQCDVLLGFSCSPLTMCVSFACSSAGARSAGLSTGTVAGFVSPHFDFFLGQTFRETQTTAVVCCVHVVLHHPGS